LKGDDVVFNLDKATLDYASPELILVSGLELIGGVYYRQEVVIFFDD
jgi:hypothetical protein